MADRTVTARSVTAVLRHPTAAGIALGVTLDAAVGDPRRWHPVAAFGRAAGTAESLLWRDSRTAGIVYAAGCVAAPVGVAAALERAAASRPAVRIGLTALATWTVVGARSLARQATAMAAALDAGDLPSARGRLPTLCGRDPASLDGRELARATVESVAENTSDAAVAPLLWGGVLGLPGLLGYRAVNTLDAMVGYRSARHQRFGWATARLDDAVNWVPARITAVLAVLLAPLVGGRSADALAVLRRDGPRHPSPNAGRCEAAFAGALGVRLGGRNSYDGTVEQRPALGTGAAPSPADVTRAVRLGRVVTGVAAVAAVALAVLVRR